VNTQSNAPSRNGIYRNRVSISLVTFHFGGVAVDSFVLAKYYGRLLPALSIRIKSLVCGTASLRAQSA